MKRFARRLAFVAISVLLIIGALTVTLYSGVYDIAADAPHWTLTRSLLHTLRERSIDVRARSIVVPDLNTPERLREGAEHYAAMCVACHLAPGVNESELRRGLNPQPPDLSRQRIDARRAYWVIRHGIKMSGMPAWGLTHDDESLWGLVAFVQKLPEMDAQQYRDRVAQASADELRDADESGHAHEHDGGHEGNGRGHEPDH